MCARLNTTTWMWWGQLNVEEITRHGDNLRKEAADLYISILIMYSLLDPVLVRECTLAVQSSG